MADAMRKKTKLRQSRKAFEEAFPKQIELVFLLQDWSDGYNVGGLFRVAAACGAAAVYGTGRTPGLEHPTVAVTSMGMHRRVPFHQFRTWEDAVMELRGLGFTLVAVEVTDSSEHYMAFQYPAKTCLVLGNEGAGISAGLLRACDAQVHIPMYGKGRSLNVHVAAAIVGFEAMLRGSEGC